MKKLHKRLDTQNESVYNIGIVNERENIMTPATFKNRYMTKVKFFAKYKKEPFDSFETLEDTYEMPEISSSEIFSSESDVSITLSSTDDLHDI